MTQQDIINFLSGFNPSGAPLTAAQLSDLTAQLKNQVSQLSATVPNSQGATTLLYSGPMGDSSKNGIGVHSGAVAQSLVDANPGKIVTINQTEVASLLQNRAFQGTLLTALGNNNATYALSN
jgi:hypothetical protein